MNGAATRILFLACALLTQGNKAQPNTSELGKAPPQTLKGEDDFERVVESIDREFKIISKGTVSSGTSHGSNQVTLIWESDLAPAPFVVSVGLQQGSIFPIFDHIFTFGQDSRNLIAIGWSSGGSGVQTYSAWLFNLGTVPRLSDYVDINCARSDPGIQFDSTSGELAVLAYEGPAGSCLDNDDFAISINTGNGAGFNLCEPKMGSGMRFSKGIRYDDHAFSQKLHPAKKTRVLAVIRVKGDRFLVQSNLTGKSK